MLQKKWLKNPYYKSLTRKMVLLVILVSVTPMILVGSVILHQFQVSYKEKIQDHLEELVDNHKQHIDNFLKEKLSNIKYLSTAYSLADLRDPDFLQNKLEILQQTFDPVFVDLGVVNAEGDQIAYAGPFKLGRAHYAEAEWFKNAIQSNYYISDVFLGLRGMPHFIIAVRSENDGKSWILRSTIDFVAFNYLVENIRVGKTGFAYILNQNGELQTQTLTGKALEKNKNFKRMDLSTVKNRKAPMAGIYEAEDGKHLNVVAALKDGEWILVYQQDKKDAYADIYQTQKIALIIMVLGGLGILTGAVLLSVQMAKRIARADNEKEIMTQQIIETGKLASVGELAAGIAHEINNPVAIMVEEAGWIQDLMEEEEFQQTENLAEFSRALQQIQNQGKRCKEITHKLLSFARKTDTQIGPVDVNDLIRDVVALSLKQAKYSKVAIRTQLSTELSVIEASQTELQQVFLNLINNAVDAMRKTGGTLLIKTWKHQNEIHALFQDTGPGIPQANIGRVFDPFFTTKQVGRGTGLGLSICYGIIKKMGGDISVESEVGRGTQFSLRIPVHQKPPAYKATRHQSAATPAASPEATA